jgi:TusA-related sulfurtransferase
VTAPDRSTGQEDEAVDPADLVVDARGLRCPLPVIRLAQAVRDAETTLVVEVLATDPAARADIPAWCRMRGHEYLGERAAESGHAAYRVRVAPAR